MDGGTGGGEGGRAGGREGGSERGREGEDISDSTEEGAAVIAGFNAWISFVHRCSEAHDLAFVPVHGGTIVAVRKLS